MSASSIASGNQVTRFKKKVLREYVRGGKFGDLIGMDENKVIQVTDEVKKFSVPLVGKLSGSGVRGSSQLAGSEEPLSNFAVTLQPTYVRNGVLIDNEENEKSEFDLFAEGRPSLMNWMMETKRDQIIQALGAVQASGTYYNYGGVEASGAKGSSAASAANMDTWQAANSDRILYGDATSQLTSGDHTTSLATVTTTDTMDRGMVELLKRIAMDADPLIRPIMVNDDEPSYVLFLGKYAFRDLRTDLETLHSNGLPRSATENPLWKGGDLMYDNVIIKEIPDIDKFIDNSSGSGLWDGVWGANATGDSLLTGGLSSARVGVGFLCGAQALGFGIGKTAQFKSRKEDDYEHLNGVAISAKHDIKKLFYNNVQHGVVTSFHYAAAD
jgi:hypothetical protein